MNKPLSKEDKIRAEQLFRLLAYHYNLPVDQNMHSPELVITALLAAEAYWRETVKNADIYDCPFCGADGVYLRAKAEQHKPDCPWLLAQE